MLRFIEDWLSFIVLGIWLSCVTGMFVFSHFGLDSLGTLAAIFSGALLIPLIQIVGYSIKEGWRFTWLP